MLELIGALAAQAVDVVSAADMLEPRMTTLWTGAQLGKLARPRPPLLRASLGVADGKPALLDS